VSVYDSGKPGIIRAGVERDARDCGDMYLSVCFS
jgi:hypothetical protein